MLEYALTQLDMQRDELRDELRRTLDNDDATECTVRRLFAHVEDDDALDEIVSRVLKHRAWYAK